MANTGAPLNIELMETGERSPEIKVNAAILKINTEFGNLDTSGLDAKLDKSSNLSDLSNFATARTNLGLGDSALLIERLDLNLASLGTLIVLSSSQYRAKNIKLTGTLANNVTIEFPALSDRVWNVYDFATHGAFTISVKKTGGSTTVLTEQEIVVFG
jgi:hypothetical protein